MGKIDAWAFDIPSTLSPFVNVVSLLCDEHPPALLQALHNGQQPALGSLHVGLAKGLASGAAMETSNVLAIYESIAGLVAQTGM